MLNELQLAAEKNFPCKVSKKKVFLHRHFT